MRYRVQGVQTPDTDGQYNMTHVVNGQDVISGWYVADTSLGAAAMFVLDHPEVNNDPILVVSEMYDMGNYPVHAAKWAADHLVGLRG